MSYNGSGTFNINSAGQPVVTGTVITSTAFNALTADLATGLSTALTKDGQTTPTANIPMGTYKITGLGAGTVATDAVRLSQLQNGGTTTYITAAGTDTITGTVTPTLTAYATGQQFSFVVAATNTAAVTLNVDGVGAKAVTRTGSVALVAGDMVTGQVVIVEYDGTRFQLINGNSFTNLKASGTLGVTGATTLSSTLGVTGLTTLGVTGAGFPGSTSGTTTLLATAVAGTTTLTLPAATDTLVGKATTDTLTNKTITSPTITNPIINSITGAVIASQASMEGGTAVTEIVTPGRQQFHPSAAKGWAKCATNGTVALAYNVTSVTDVATGRVRINWTVPFSNAEYVGVANAQYDTSLSATTSMFAQIRNVDTTANILAVDIIDANGTAFQDPNYTMASAFGDQ